MTKYVLKYRATDNTIKREWGLYVSVDAGSGGYPSNVELHRAEFFATLGDAIRYADHWPKRFTVEEVTFSTKQID